MLTKLKKLYQILNNKNPDNELISYRLTIYVYKNRATVDIVPLFVGHTGANEMFLKFGDITENFDINKYLAECIEDLKETK